MICVYLKSTAEFQTSGEPSTTVFPFGEREGERILAISNRKRRLQSLAALTCLDALIKKTGIGADDFEILRSADGRPFFSKIKDADFGLTHSGTLAAAALVNNACRIGIDIELVEYKKNTEKIARRFFADDELADLFSGDGKIDLETFFLIWTRKEASAKRDGRGLSAIAKRDTDTRLFFKSWRVECEDKNYILTVCADSQEEIKIYYDGEIKVDEIQDRI